MPHRCVHCGEIYSAGSKEILTGCSKCGGHFFFYIRDEHLKNVNEMPMQISSSEKKQVEKQIRDMAGITEEEAPVILDLESVRVVGSGKFEIDIINLFSKKRPLIYKLEEGKYIIDLASTMNKDNTEKRFIEISLDDSKKKKEKPEKEENKEEEIDLTGKM